MTTDFVCGERRTMASQPSVYSEERNRLRLQAWEQRNQETGQTKELNSENVPLFGEPYKTNKGDELSSRIQRMLGSYEDVNNSNSFATGPLPLTTYVTLSQLDHCQPEKATKPPFHSRVHCISSQCQKGPCSNSCSAQAVRMADAPSSPSQHGHSSTFSKASLKHSQGSQLDQSTPEQKKSDAFLDLKDRVRIPWEMSAQSPDAKTVDFLHSSDHDSTDTKDIVDRHQLQESTDPLSSPASTMDVSTLNTKHSPKDVSLSQSNKTNVLPSQTFPLLLSSKQPTVVMTQKPTAYVRPMDGQDQVISESPELKPSPEPYVPLPELINKTDAGKTKKLAQFLETKTNETQCVEDILKEMTHSWPPLLTAIHTPSTDETSKEPEHVSSYQGQKNCDPSPTDPSQLNQLNSSFSFEAAHSSGAEPASSSDSESSSRSESDSESADEEPLQPAVSSSVKTEPDAPPVSHGDWQLGNWIRSNQQNFSTESQGGALVSESPVHKQPLPTESFKHSSVDVINPSRESKLSSHQNEFSDSVAKPQQCGETSQDSSYQQSSQQSLSTDSSKLSCNTQSSKPVKAGCPDHTKAVHSVKREDVAATRVKDPCFTDRPKVKTKTRSSKKSKDNSDPKRDSKRTKRTLLDKQKAGPEPEPEVTLILYGHCPSCGVRYPEACPCPSQSPAQPEQLSSAPLVRISCSKFKTENTCQKGIKTPHKTTHKHSEKIGHTSKGSLDLSRPPGSLVVKIDLSLLSQVPRTSNNHQRIISTSKRSTLVVEQDGGGSEASTIHKRTKTSKKSIPQNTEVDNKTHPRKKQKLENKNTSTVHASVKMKHFSHPIDDQEQKKTKKKHVQLQQPRTPKDTSKGSKLQKSSCGAIQDSHKDAVKSKDSCKQKSVKQTVHTRSEKQKAPKSSRIVSSTSQPIREAVTNRSLLRFDDRQYPVKHYIKEAKRLKHKADAESDKLSKAFSYLDAAMYFVESGIAMEKDPQISMSSYTMFADTVELLKFVLKLKNSTDPSAPPSEKDFIALCLKCQSLLQMAMFRHKHKTALQYSKTLTEHFSTSAQAPQDPSVLTSRVTDTPSPMPSMLSPANTSTSSGPDFNHSAAPSSVGTAAAPQPIEQVAFTYVNITTLFLSAHDMWEQAEELARKGSGILAQLDTVMGLLSLTSSMSFMVRYTRQGVHWLRLDSQKIK